MPGVPSQVSLFWTRLSPRRSATQKGSFQTLYGVNNMKKLLKHINIFIATVLIQGCLVGCAGFGVFATKYPAQKLDDAKYLYTHNDRALMAEQLICEAIEIYKEQQDNEGSGLAHWEYACLLLSPSVVTWEKFYREHGFRDQSVTFENRASKAIEYQKNAMEFFIKAE